ncbi:transcriptional coactivator/pterin dehydratase [Alkaliphilus metalliredigens QYMF]|uniref:Putative pterin-4-alpha-carbinolamine dehydratase n=1 Tax=Alkaliphilus metalliredigens (strain QYMF) TaxID=293826 RepID=PHS_ALKMQ|nr:4a-hydroxytetrahydrobiopterin dehydratase [Alkaliphilus metalliredigens]A6TVX6.1 RecName: Full=Putative pterin-4-alpha-carbinolamine dehydratase; Short=PHS; AltName: Full=4-alpha-hydroxy-tetrahydropterin dehydratase; AltName: Full=Pterin carbinolamine dehydratase; Short=PCD [Alkaliphilus metalliredigens QYMF]ABR50344.1 transcriptional coactivator/pterin dehydratase [Alkaliphilus metalliredigens QYMF]
MNNLAEKKCIPCSLGTPPLSSDEIKRYISQLHEEWKVINDHHLEREFKFKNFKEALSYTNVIGQLAEKEGHHPDMLLSWGKVKITLFTHKIDGLSESDFVFAAKVDKQQSE